MNAIEFDGILPPDKAGLTLEHNPHKDYGCFEGLQAWLDVHEDLCDWASDEQKNRAIAANDFWMLQWYPNSSVGFNCFAAPTVSELMDMVREYLK